MINFLFLVAVIACFYYFIKAIWCYEMKVYNLNFSFETIEDSKADK